MTRKSIVGGFGNWFAFINSTEGILSQVMTETDMEPTPTLESEISLTIALLQEHFEVVRRVAIQRVRGRLGNLSPQQANAVDSLTRGIIEKILQAPIAILKNTAASNESTVVLEAARRIFNLRT
jgi:glutamyl-tRNA reductase